MENPNLYVVISSPIFVATMEEADADFFYSEIRKMPGIFKDCPKKRLYISAYEGLVVSTKNERFSIFRDVVKAEYEDKVLLLIDRHRHLERYLIDQFVRKYCNMIGSQITPHQFNVLIQKDLGQVFSYTDVISEFNMRS